MKTYPQFSDVYQKATLWLAVNKSLFSQLMYAVQNDVVDTDEVPTAATTGKRRIFNPTFMEGMPIAHQSGVMVHEILHDALLHTSRREDRHPLIWNIACDIVINQMILSMGMQLPSEAILDWKGDRFIGHTEEQVYDAIMNKGSKSPKCNGGIGYHIINGNEGGQPYPNGSGSPDGSDSSSGAGNLPIPAGYKPDLIGKDMTPDDIARAKSALQNAIETHGIGSAPAALREAIEGILNPKELWHERLRRFFTSKQYSGCDWTAICRREYMRSGMIAPPFQSDSLGTVVISVDQSGSISQEELEEFASHVNSILMDCKPHKVVVQYFDTEVHETEEFMVQDLPITLRRVCGGGTSFVDACERASEHEAQVHIVLTDMYGEFPKDCDIATIWASTSRVTTAPFGEVISIREE